MNVGGVDRNTIPTKLAGKFTNFAMCQLVDMFFLPKIGRFEISHSSNGSKYL